MNKLLFYADFSMFKQSCFSISGMRYSAIDMGPVPNNFQSIFEYLSNNKEIDIYTTEFQNGYIGEKLEILEKVANVFKDTSTSDIIKLSHLEEAY